MVWVAGAVAAHIIGALDYITGAMFALGLLYTIGLRPEVAAALRGAPELVLARLRKRRALPPGDG